MGPRERARKKDSYFYGVFTGFFLGGKDTKKKKQVNCESEIFLQVICLRGM